MAEITRSATLAAPAADVWALVGDFAGIAGWHPGTAVPALRGPTGGDDVDPIRPGVERVFAGGTPDEFVERLVARWEDRRLLVYTIPDPPFPITGHEASIVVRELDGGRSEVVWTARFASSPETADGLEAGLGDGVFAVGLDALTDRFGGA